MESLSWIAFICSIAGNLLINIKSVWGFSAWILSNGLWLWFDLYNCGWKITKANRARILMHLIYSGFNIHGFINWRR